MKFQLLKLVNQESMIGFPYVGFCTESNRLIGFCNIHVRMETISPAGTKMLEEDYIATDTFFDFDVQPIDAVVARCIGMERYSDLTVWLEKTRNAAISYEPEQEGFEEWLNLDSNPRYALLLNEVYAQMEPVLTVAKNLGLDKTIQVLTTIF